MKRRGLTLIEIIVAMIIVAITSVCSLEFFRFCHKCFILNTESRFVAANYARETMESFYNQPYADLVEAWEAPDPFTTSNPKLSGATRTYSVRDAGDYKVITVIVKDWAR